MKDTSTGIKRILKAFGYTRDGLTAAFREDVAFRQEVYMSAVLIPLAFWLTGDGVSRALMIGSVVLILLCELLNSAIEAIVDRIGPEIHPLSKKAKDVGSATVFVAFVNAAAVWLLILL